MNSQISPHAWLVRSRHLVYFLGIFFSLGACQGEDPPKPELLRAVRSQTVFFSNAEQVRTFSGVAKAGLEANLSFKVSGTVSQLYVKVGDRIKKKPTPCRIGPQRLPIGSPTS